MTALLRRALGLVLAATLPATPRQAVAPLPPAVVAETEAAPEGSLARVPRGLRPGDALRIAGRVSSRGVDSRDEFAFRTETPCVIRVVLHPTLPGSDLRLTVRDPLRDDVLARTVLARTDGPRTRRKAELELGAAGRELRVVVESAWGASTYLLEVEAGPFLRGETL